MSMYASMLTDVAKIKSRLSTIDQILRQIPLPQTKATPVATPDTASQNSIDLAQQLQDLAVAKQAHQANQQIMSSADSLLDRLYEIQSARLTVSMA